MIVTSNNTIVMIHWVQHIQKLQNKKMYPEIAKKTEIFEWQVLSENCQDHH